MLRKSGFCFTPVQKQPPYFDINQARRLQSSGSIFPNVISLFQSKNTRPGWWRAEKEALIFVAMLFNVLKHIAMLYSQTPVCVYVAGSALNPSIYTDKSRPFQGCGQQNLWLSSLRISIPLHFIVSLSSHPPSHLSWSQLSFLRTHGTFQPRLLVLGVSLVIGVGVVKLEGQCQFSSFGLWNEWHNWYPKHSLGWRNASVGVWEAVMSALKKRSGG